MKKFNFFIFNLVLALCLSSISLYADDFPTEETTGTSGSLTSYSGDMTITTNGAVVENMNISGKIYIKANNVTIRNCKFAALDIATADSYYGTVAEDCEMWKASRHNFTLRRCKLISQSSDLLRFSGSNITIEDCFLYITGPRIDDDHSDIVQEYPLNSGINKVIRHNTMWLGMNQNACIFKVSNVLIENNLIAGGGYAIYATENASIINNHFSTKFYSSCGAFGRVTGTAGCASGNVWHETGLPVNISTYNGPCYIEPVTGVSVSPSSLSLNAGENSPLTKVISPSGASDQSVVWSSSNTSVATVNSSGVVSAVSQGTVTITATTNDGGFTDNCIVTVTNSLPPATSPFYCDPVNGSMSNNGSESTPWSTLEAVFAAGKTFQAGDTIYLLSGDHGAVSIQGANSGDVTITAAPGENPKIDYIIFNNASHWVISNVTIYPEFDPGTIDFLVQMDINSTHNTIDNCSMYSATSCDSWSESDWSIKTWSAFDIDGPNNTFKNNEIENIRWGFRVDYTAINTLGEYNTIANVMHDAIQSLASYCTYQYNTCMNMYAIDGNHDDFFQCYSYNGSSVGTTTVYGVIIRGNTFISFTDPAQPFKSEAQGIGNYDGMYEDWIVENNLIITDMWHGISFYGAKNCTFVNNTILKNPIDAHGMVPWLYVNDHKDGTASTGNIIKNNIASDLQIDPQSGDISNNIETTSYSSYFADYSNFDFHLSSSSPAIDAGVATNAPAVDLEGIARPQGAGYDIGCYEYVGSGTIPVTGVSVLPTSLALDAGQSSDLTETVAPVNATDQSVIWSSTNTSVATVDANGLVTALDEGTATITVTTNDGGFTAICDVTVTVPVTGVSVSPTTLVLDEGQSSSLTETISPTNATDQTVSWSSSNDAVATVDTNGLVTTVSPGSATITATTNDGGFTATCDVTVTTSQSAYVTQSLPGRIQVEDYDYGGQDVAYNELDGDKRLDTSIRPQDQVDLYTTSDVDGNISIGWAIDGEWLEYTLDNVVTGTYDISVRAVADFETPGNLVLSLGDGPDGTNLTQIASVTIDNTGGWTSWQTFTVTSVPITGGSNKVLRVTISGVAFDLNWIDFSFSAVPAAGVSVSPTTDSIDVGTTIQLTETVLPIDATDKSVTWSSSNDTIATVDTNGLVTAVSPGSATIIATTNDGGFTATCDITVTTPQSAYVTQSLPGRIQIEDYDYGGQDVAYNELDGDKRLDTSIRPQDQVDLYTTSDVDGNISIGWAIDGEWLEYTLDNVVTGTYDISVRAVADFETPGNLILSLGDGPDGTNLTQIASITIDNTGGWTSWQTFTVTSVPITGGSNKVLRVTISGVAFDLNWIDFSFSAVPVTGVSVSPTTLALDEGQSSYLTETVLPVDATDKSVIWSSSNDAVATVDANGLVIAVSAGSCTITVTTNDGSYTATCTVVVEAVQQTITLNPVADAFVRGGTYENNNYGTQSTLIVKNAGISYTRESYIKFDLSGITNPVSSAVLRLFLSEADDGGATHTVSLVSDDSWTETGITYANKPAAGSAITSWDVTATGNYYIEADITSTAILEAGGLLTLQISSNDGDYVYYDSKEAVNKPELVIVTNTQSNSQTLEKYNLTDNNLDFKIYPNPVVGKEFNIQLPASDNQIILNISTITGKKVLSLNVPQEEDQIVISRNQLLQSGIYIISVFNGSSYQYKKVIVH